jgi:hypothetical protein
MKRAALLVSGLLLSAFVSGPAAAEVVRVRVTARVSQLNDPSNVLAGKVVVGSRVNGLYVYNTNTPNTSPMPGYGDYRPYANEGRLRIAVGSLVFESKQPTQGIGILIRAENNGSAGLFNIMSHDNKPLADGTTVNLLQVMLDGFGNVTQSIALPPVAPVPSTYWNKDISVSANGPNGAYSFQAQIEAAELVIPDAIVVTPASGQFAANQHFDAALLLPRNTLVHYWEATVNGQYLPMYCEFQQQVGAGRPSLLCPGADQVLSTLPPGAAIEFMVSLTNGVVYNETVTWERAP